MLQGLYFRWYPDVRVVYGVLRAAVYDFRTGTVYSLNSSGAAVIQTLDTAAPLGQLTEQEQHFVAELLELGLGDVGDQPLPHNEEKAVDPSHPLEFLWLELVSGCNLACSHCYAESQNPLLYSGVVGVTKEESTADPLTVEEWNNVIQEGAALGCRSVQFIGGEVLLHRDLLRLIDQAHTSGYTFIEIFTNGTLLTEAKVKALATRQVQIAVSLHGTEAAVHDNITGLTGSFERTLAGLRRLRSYNIPFRVAGTAMASNQQNILQLDMFAKNLGAEYSSFDIVRAVGSGDDPKLMPNDVAIFERKWLTQPRFVANRRQYDHNRHWNPCWAGKLAVTSSGYVMPCVMGRSEVVGNLRQDTLATVLETPRLRYLWGITKDQVAICRDCEYRYICGDCRPLAMNSGDLHGAVPRCTYRPRQGDWGQPGTTERRFGPAAESPLPLIGRVTGNRQKESFSTEESEDYRQLNHHFKCDPERS